MKTFSKQELKAKAKEVFKDVHGSVIYATSDGQMFFNKNRAELHANSGKDKLGVYDFERSETLGKPETDDDELTVDDIKSILPGIDAVDRLEALIKNEQSGKNRKTAISAIEDRISEINETKTND